MHLDNISSFARVFIPAALAGGLLSGCADTGDLVTSGSTAATSASTTAEANDYAYERARRFESNSHVALRKDVASGQGEHLDAFATLMRVEDETEFGKRLQARYAELYPPQAAPGELVDRVVKLGLVAEPIQRASR